MVNIVIPMAGLGSRFMKADYVKPKPFIDVLGKPMIVRVLENLNLPTATFILIYRKEHYEEEKAVFEEIENRFNVHFIEIEQLSEGPAATVLYANKYINNDIPLVIANSDQIVDMGISDFIEQATEENLDGSILTFQDTDPKWSYVKLDNNLVSEVKEKEVISTFATVGIYYYKRGKDFVNAALDMIVRNERVNGEFYVCPTYNFAIQQGKKIGIFNIEKHQMHGTGTPNDLEKYIQEMKYI